MNSAAKQNAQALSGIEDICQQSPLRFWLAKDLWTSVDSFQPQSFTTWEHLEAIKKWKSTNSRNLCSLNRFQNCRGYAAMVCYGYWVSWFTSHPAILDVTNESFSTLSSCEELHQSTERLKKRHRFISWGTASKRIIDMDWYGVIWYRDISLLYLNLSHYLYLFIILQNFKWSSNDKLHRQRSPHCHAIHPIFDPILAAYQHNPRYRGSKRIPKDHKISSF